MNLFFFKRLARSMPMAFIATFDDQSKSDRNLFRVPLDAIAAISGGFSYYFYSSSSSPNFDSFHLHPFSLNRRQQYYMVS
ncbi:hypothetical protein Droror1_Dr00023810 [Drosera rotundifolia]